MWKAYLKADAYILGIIQDAYLWLLDRTGVYVATLCFMIYATAAFVALSTGAPLLFWGPLLLMVGLSMLPRYTLQDKARNEHFNAIALMLQGWLWRHPFQIALSVSMLAETIALEPLQVLIDICFLLYTYMTLVMIRDRDKKPFFKPVENQELAMQHHGSD